MPTPNTGLLEQLRADCERYRTASSVAPRTQINYASDWKAFAEWCHRQKLNSLPAANETLSLYVADMIAKGRKITSARRSLFGIVYGHMSRGLAPPSKADAALVLAGAQRVRCEQRDQKLALTLSELAAIAAACTNGAAGARDRAICVLGFASALRRSNLAMLDLADVEFAAQGLILLIRREKQDRQSRGRNIGLPRGEKPLTCPVRALEDWLQYRGQAAGPLFTAVRRPYPRLNPQWIGELVKRRVSAIGLDPKLYGAHSLRSGFVTAAAEKGIHELVIAAQTGHHSMDVLRRYFRKRDLWRANAAGMIGL